MTSNSDKLTDERGGPMPDERGWTLVRLSNSEAWCIAAGEVEARPEGMARVIVPQAQLDLILNRAMRCRELRLPVRYGRFGERKKPLKAG